MVRASLYSIWLFLGFFLLHGLSSYGQEAEQIPVLPDSILIKQKEAVTDEDKAEVDRLIARYFHDELQYAIAIEYFDKSLERYRMLRDTVKWAGVQTEIALCYLRQRDFEKALKANFEALELWELSREWAYMARTQARVGNIYMEMYQMDKAKEYFDMMMELANEVGDTNAMLEANSNMGVYYRRQEEYGKAITHQTLALDYARAIKDSSRMLNSIFNLSTVLGYQEKYEESLDLLNEALELNKTHGDRFREAGILGNIGWQQYLMGNIEESVGMFQEVLAIAKELNDPELLERSYRSLARIYAKSGDYKQAYEVHVEFIKQLQENLELELADGIAEMTAQYESEKKQREIELLKRKEALKEEEEAHKRDLYEAEIDKQRAINYFTFGGIFLLLVIAFVIIRNNRQKAKAKEELSRRQAEISEQQALIAGQELERKRVAQELHDGIGGSLSIIKMKMTELSQQGSITNELSELASEMGRACQEVRNISHDLAAIDVEGEDLFSAVRKYVDGLVQGTEIQVSYDFFPDRDPGDLGQSVRHASYRIIQELARNAVRHGDPGALTIGIIRDEQGVAIMVEDNGRGFEIKEGELTGMGLKSVQRRIETLDGEFSCESVPGKGTTFHILLPV